MNAKSEFQETAITQPSSEKKEKDKKESNKEARKRKTRGGDSATLEEVATKPPQRLEKAKQEFPWSSTKSKKEESNSVDKESKRDEKMMSDDSTPTLEANLGGGVLTRSRAAVTNMLKRLESDNDTTDSVYNLNTRETLGIVFLIMAFMIACVDSYSFISISPDVDRFYDLEDSSLLILHSSFPFTYAILAPIFGYIGDRLDRKRMMMLGMLCWSTVNAASSLIPNTHYPVFLSMRVMFAIGECIFCVPLHSVIADMFRGKMRLKAFSIMYLAVPMGGGIGFACGKFIPVVTGQWQYVLLYTVPMVLICTLVVGFTLSEPAKVSDAHRTGLRTDLGSLFGNTSFFLCVVTSMSLSCVTGFLKAWFPVFLHLVNLKKNPYAKIEETMSFGSLVFGLGGITGVILQYGLVSVLGHGINPMDMIAGGIITMASAPFIYLLFMFYTFSFLSWTFLFLTAMTVVATLAFKIELIMSVVVPTKRTLAFGLHEFVSNLIGETLSPYFVGSAGGLLSKNFELQNIWIQIKAMQSIVAIPCFLSLCAGGGYFLISFSFENDCHEIKEFGKPVRNEEIDRI